MNCRINLGKKLTKRKIRNDKPPNYHLPRDTKLQNTQQQKSFSFLPDILYELLMHDGYKTKQNQNTQTMI